MEFHWPKCANGCGKDAVSIDSFCSPECRKESYVKRGWKEPKNPKGWCVAEFQSYIDVENISPQEIEGWNNNVNNADEKMAKLTVEKEKLDREIEEIYSKIMGEFPFFQRISEGIFWTSEDDEGFNISDLKVMIKAYENHDKNKFERLSEIYAKLNQKKSEIDIKIREQEVWVDRKKHKYFLHANR